MHLIRPALALALMALPAAAHPHVFIEMRSDVVFNGAGLITAVNVSWQFDAAYTEAALDGLDTDGDGVYSAAEIAPLTKENMQSLQEWDYFTTIKVDGVKAAVSPPAEFGQIWSNNLLALHFTLPLKQPVDPRKQQFVYRIYDPTFFIGLDYAKDNPVTAQGTLPPGCRVDVKPVVADEQLAQTQSMLAEKGKDWTPAPEEDFGAMFAQPVSVVCG